MRKYAPIAQLVDLPAGRQGSSRKEKMLTVYVLRSLKDGWLYIGMTNDLIRRLRQHNNGSNFSTKYRRPFKLIYEEKVTDRISARLREKELKSGSGREWLRTLRP